MKLVLWSTVVIGGAAVALDDAEEEEEETSWICSANLGIHTYRNVSLNFWLLTSHFNCLACFLTLVLQ